MDADNGLATSFSPQSLPARRRSMVRAGAQLTPLVGGGKGEGGGLCYGAALVLLYEAEGRGIRKYAAPENKSRGKFLHAIYLVQEHAVCLVRRHIAVAIPHAS